MGWENVFHCEWNEFGQKVLKHYWPKAISYEDITKTDFTIHRGNIDILTGGFPCQPYSSAGKRLGKEDERHLWPQMLRAIREIKPRWIVGENVYGLVNWSNGLVFHEIQTDLENQGYEVLPFLCPALSVNAPHVRNRIFFIAHAKFDTKGQNNRTDGEKAGAIRGDEESNVLRTLCSDGSSSNPNGIRLWGQSDGVGNPGFIGKNSQRSDWSNFPTVSPIRTGNDGIPDRLDSITFSKWRNESIKAGGNAVVPQVVYQIFKTIEAYEILNNVHNPAH